LTRESVGGTNTTYLYDPNGNLTKKDDGTNVDAYGYNWLNLMTSYDGPGTSNDATYTYDAEARRVTKNVNGSKTAYIYDFWNVVADYNGSNQLQATYVTPGLDDNLTMTRSGSTYYYLQDGLGSIRNVLDGDETGENAYDYDAFGKTYGTPTENVTNRYRFTGREWDSESSLYYYRARNYSAGTGSLPSREPDMDGSGRSLYCYVSCSPVSWTDPSGLTKIFVDKQQNYDFSDLGKTCAQYGFQETHARETDVRDHVGHMKADDIWVYFGHTGRKNGVPGHIMTHRRFRRDKPVPISDVADWISQGPKGGTGAPPALAVLASCDSCQVMAPSLLAAGVRCVACFDAEVPAGAAATMVKNAFRGLCTEGKTLQTSFFDATAGVMDDGFFKNFKIICSDPSDVGKTLPELLSPGKR
jgi:RHS repeat-associated protein